MDDKLPCGWLFKLPRFCRNRKCETCILRKNKQTNGYGCYQQKPEPPEKEE